ncbi:hypothetical protein, partial [Pseudomonas helleri]|uniref:hypothetical protein n=1 Tax=Pseudomonas helleri TaxID=1608996 RepID=UPI001E536492
MELKVAMLEARGSDIHRSDRTVAIGEHNHSRMVPEIELHRVLPTGEVSFYDEFFKSEREKRKLIGNEENEESLKKQAAKA